jgi:hypothetical protein
MKTPTIKFSHRYPKLVSSGAIDGYAVLLDVIPVNLEELSKPFLDYDTDYGRYELPKKGRYLLLLLESGRGLFTTIRRQTPQKESYYRGLIDETFEVSMSGS